MKPPKFRTTFFVVLGIFAVIFVVRFIHDQRKEKYSRTDYGSPYRKSLLMAPETFIELATTSEESNRYKDALLFYQIGTKYFPKNLSLWVGIANVQGILGNREGAADSLKIAIQLAPEDPTLLAQLSQLFFQTNKFPEAYESMKKAVALDRENKDYLIKLAQLANLNKQYAVSYKTYEQLAQEEPLNKDFQLGLIKTRAWVKEPKSTDYEETLLNETKASFAMNNTVKARELMKQYVVLFGNTQAYQHLLPPQIYAEMIKQDPKDSETRYRLAQFYFQFNQPEEASHYIEEALKLDEHNTDYLQLKVLVAKQLNLVEEEKETYETILAIKPKDEEIKKQLILLDVTDNVSITSRQIEENPLLLKVVMEEQKGNVTGALDSLEEYGKAEGQNMIYQGMLVYLASKIDKCSLQCIDEREELTKLAKRFSFFGDMQFGEAQILQEKASLITEKIVSQNPCSTEALDLRASTIRLFEDPPFVDLFAAQLAYRRLLNLDPCNQKALYNLARVTALLEEVDEAAALYKCYLRSYPPERDVLIEYADLLEDQGNIGLALHYNCLCERLFGLDTYLKEKRAHILNSGELSTPAMAISLELLDENPDSYNGWLNYTNAAAILNYPYQSLYGFDQIFAINPGRPTTSGARWTVWPDLLNSATLSGRFYQETTTLTEYFQRLEGSYSVRPDLKIEAGTEFFETSASNTFNAVLGLGNLRGINGEVWGSEASAWIGIDKLINSKLNASLRVGGGTQRVGDISSSTPTFLLNLLMPLCDNLDVDFFSSYGFMLISPRNLSLKIREWRNFLSIDWMPCWGYELWTTIDGKVNTDGNKQLEIYLYPRKTIKYLEHWKVVAGLMGTWLTSHKFRETGYYQPHLYQGYATELLVDYRFDDLNVIKAEGTIGMQKDSLSTQFGFLGNLQCRGIFNLNMNWNMELFGEYFYLDSTNGYFSYLDFGGGLTYRF